MSEIPAVMHVDRVESLDVMGEGNAGVRIAAGVATLVLGAFAVVALLMGVSSSSWMLMAVALTACAVVTWPLALPSTQTVNPWLVYVVTVYLTVGVRTAFIVADYPSSTTIRDLFTLGLSKDDLVAPGIWLTVFLLLVSCGYVVGSRRRGASQAWRGRHLHPSRHQVRLLVLGLSVVGLVGLVLFVDGSGGLARLSAKRNLVDITSIGVDPTYQSFGHFRFLHRFSAVGLLVYLVTRSRRQLSAGEWIIALALYLLAISLPFYANTRSEVIFLTISVAAWFYLRGGARIKLRPVLVGVAVALVLFQVLTMLRTSRDATASDVLVGVAEERPLDSVILTRNLVSVPRTAHVWYALRDGELDLKYGSTMASWTYGWVPRAVWRSKPPVLSGVELGPVIYDHTVGGAPPGLPAESFWNFGFVGGLLVAPLAGWLLGLVDARVSPGRGSGNEMQLMIYLLVMLPLVSRILGDSVTQGVISAARDLGIAWGGLLAVSFIGASKSAASSEHDSA